MTKATIKLCGSPEQSIFSVFSHMSTNIKNYEGYCVGQKRIAFLEEIPQLADSIGLIQVPAGK